MNGKFIILKQKVWIILLIMISEDWRDWFGKREGFGFECTWSAKFGVWIFSRHLEMRY